MSDNVLLLSGEPTMSVLNTCLVNCAKLKATDLQGIAQPLQSCRDGVGIRGYGVQGSM